MDLQLGLLIQAYERSETFRIVLIQGRLVPDHVFPVGVSKHDRFKPPRLKDQYAGPLKLRQGFFPRVSEPRPEFVFALPSVFETAGTKGQCANR